MRCTNGPYSYLASAKISFCLLVHLFVCSLFLLSSICLFATPTSASSRPGQTKAHNWVKTQFVPSRVSIAPIGEVAWKKKAFLSSTGLFTKWERDLDFGWHGFRTRASAIARVTKAISVVKVSAGGGGGTLGGWLISMAEINEGGKSDQVSIKGTTHYGSEQPRIQT